MGSSGGGESRPAPTPARTARWGRVRCRAESQSGGDGGGITGVAGVSQWQSRGAPAGRDVEDTPPAPATCARSHVCTPTAVMNSAELSQRPATRRTQNTYCPALCRNVRRPFLAAKEPSVRGPGDLRPQSAGPGGSVAAVFRETAGRARRTDAWRAPAATSAHCAAAASHQPTVPLRSRGQRRRAPESHDPATRPASAGQNGSPSTS